MKPDKSVKHGKSVREILLEGTRAPASSGSLQFVWVKIVSEVTGQYVAPLTMQQIGQLKQFVNRSPKGQAQAILEHVLRNWIEFVKAAEQEAGLKSTPANPHVGFLLQHVATAANLYLQSKKPVSKEVAPVVSVAATVQLIAPKPDPKPEDDKPKTLAELNAILFGTD